MGETARTSPALKMRETTESRVMDGGMKVIDMGK
jgi:hypothetical protein